MAFRALAAGLILAFSLPAPAQVVVPELGQPAWAALSPEQKQILAPLARDWDKMEAYRKKKWLGIAKRYPTMKPEEQARIQRRIHDWASLTPEQRTQARVRYKNLKTAPPERKEAIRQKWEEYKDLPDEEKKRLAEKAGRKPSSKLGIAKSRPAAPKLPLTTPMPLPAPSAPPAAPQKAAAPASPATPAVAPAQTDTSEQAVPAPPPATPPVSQQ